jgi:hypothetical protein
MTNVPRCVSNPCRQYHASCLQHLRAKRCRERVALCKDRGGIDISAILSEPEIAEDLQSFQEKLGAQFDVRIYACHLKQIVLSVSLL